MGTLLKVKAKVKTDKDLRRLLVRGTRHEVLLDLDGDKVPDIGLIDNTHDGDIDTIAVNIGGREDFDLYLVDSDANGIPDKILYDEEGDGNFQKLASGAEVEEHMKAAAQTIYMLIQAEEIIAERLDAALAELDVRVREARRELNRR